MPFLAKTYILDIKIMRVFKKSKWIWISNELNKDEYGEFFTSFYCEGSNAECRISCDGDYTMFVNGSRNCRQNHKN